MSKSSNSVVVACLVLVAGAIVVVQHEAKQAPVHSAASKPEGARPVSARRGPAKDRPALSVPRGSTMPLPAKKTTPARSPEPDADSGAQQIVCVDKQTGEPVSGILALRQDMPRVGPSGEDGRLELTWEQDVSLVLWGEGWRPVFVKAYQPLPERVELEAADCSLEVQLDNLAPGESVVRALLQSRDFHARRTDPWSPALIARAPQQLLASNLSPGEYDLYVWVAASPGAPRCLRSEHVLVRAEGTNRIYLDASDVTESEPDS